MGNESVREIDFERWVRVRQMPKTLGPQIPGTSMQCNSKPRFKARARVEARVRVGLECPLILALFIA